MKKTLLATAALIAMSTSAFALTDLSAASLSAEFPTAQKIEVNRGLFRTKVEVIIDGQKIEIFYNNTTLEEVTRRTKTVSGSDVEQMRSSGVDVHDYEVGGQYYDETDYETNDSDRHDGNDRNDREDRDNRRSERHSGKTETRDRDSSSNDFGSDDNGGFGDHDSNDRDGERDDHDGERSHQDDDHDGNDNDWDD